MTQARRGVRNLYSGCKVCRLRLQVVGTVCVRASQHRGPAQ